MHKLIKIVSLTLLMAGSAPAATAQYVTVDLHPSGASQSFARSIAGGQIVGGINAAASQGALFWANASSNALDLTPSDVTNAQVMTLFGANQAGYGVTPASQGNPHALVWSGSASTYTDLNPFGFVSSQINAGASSGYVGNGATVKHPKKSHAIVWAKGTAGVDLHPKPYENSTANGLAGLQIIGTIWDFNNLPYYAHAFMWFKLTSDGYYNTTFATDLHPSGYSASYGLGVGDGQQVGYGEIDSQPHALLWSGSAASVVDLNGAYSSSMAYAVAKGRQVGSGWVGTPTGGHSHALVWSGSAGKVIDLNQFLPPGYTDAGALGIDTEGNIVGWASTGAINQFHNVDPPLTPAPTHAFLWKPMATVSGTIALEDSALASQTLSLEFRPNDGSAVFSYTVTLGTDGSFSLPNIPAKSYTLHIKGAKWLAQNVSLTSVGGLIPPINVTLPAGDADNNNVVDFDDLTILAVAYNTVVGDPLYDDRADFNCDGQVEFADLTLLAINYNLSGDP